jgi:hypothetical protein
VDNAVRPGTHGIFFDIDVEGFATKEHPAGCLMFWPPDPAQSLHSLQLVNDPGGICEEKARDVFDASFLRIDYFDTIDAHSDPQLLTGSGWDQAELNLPAPQGDIIDRSGAVWAVPMHQP